MKKQLFLALCLTLSSANLFCPILPGQGGPKAQPAADPSNKKSAGSGGNSGGSITITPATIASAGLDSTVQAQLLAALGSIATSAAGGASANTAVTTLATDLVTKGSWSGTVASLSQSSKPSTKLGRMSSRKKRAHVTLSL